MADSTFEDSATDLIVTIPVSETPYSHAIYVGNGSTNIFTIPFPYINRDYVHVTVDDVEQVDGDNATIEWLTDASIRIMPTPASGATVFIYRDTTKEEALVDFRDGSVLNEENLDTEVTQLLHIAQETYDIPGMLIKTVNTLSQRVRTEIAQKLEEAITVLNTGIAYVNTHIAEARTIFSNIVATAAQALSNITTAGDTQTARVNEVGATQLTAITEEATRQYQRVHVAGELQTQRIVDYAEREIDKAAAQADRAQEQAQIATVAARELTSLAITVEATTTEPGVALLDRENNILRIRVPKGADGATPQFVQGTTTTTEPGTLATVTLRTVTTDTYALDFSIPRGATGAAGRDGERGPAGPSGDIVTALDAQFMGFEIDATGNLNLKYTGTALEPSYTITPEGYLEVSI